MTLPGLRWWMCGLLFLATVISYIDRQTMSVVAPVIAQEFGLNNEQIARILSSFLFAYAFGQVVAGKFLDWTGSRLGFSIFVVVWSLANMLTATVTRAWGFSLFRFLLGVGEAGNYPGGVKVLAEWFPPRERPFAGGVFTSGASIGAVMAAPLVATITHYWGWRAAFLFTGSLGFLWLAGWLWLYRTPARHPYLSSSERALLAESQLTIGETTSIRWLDLFRYRQVWAITIARFFEEPLIWLCVFWLPKFMVDVKGLSLLEMGWVLTIPYLSLDVGYIAGGWAATRLLRKGIPLRRAKLTVMAVAAGLMMATIPAAFAQNLMTPVVLISMATMGHGAWFTNVMTIPSDIAPRNVVASVYGISGLGGGLGGIVFTEITGVLADRFHSFAPSLVLAGLMPLLATLILRFVGGAGQENPAEEVSA
ncbi:MAG: MFS transporter [Acidobacteria bacterium]|nr:MFS transporter [Acidobacteriota bacterium]